MIGRIIYLPTVLDSRVSQSGTVKIQTPGASKAPGVFFNTITRNRQVVWGWQCMLSHYQQQTHLSNVKSIQHRRSPDPGIDSVGSGRTSLSPSKPFVTFQLWKVSTKIKTNRLLRRANSSQWRILKHPVLLCRIGVYFFRGRITPPYTVSEKVCLRSIASRGLL